MFVRNPSLRRGCGLDSTGSEYGQVSGSWKHGNESVGFNNGRKFFHQLSDCQFLKNDSALWNWLITVLSLISTPAFSVKSRTVEEYLLL